MGLDISIVDIKKMPKIKVKQTRNIYSVRGNRSTRYAYVSLKESKEAKCAVEFLDKVIEFFPIKYIDY